MAAPVLPAVTHTDMDRGIALGPNCLDGLVVHGDDFTGVNDLDGKSGDGRITVKLRPQLRFVSDQQSANTVVARGLNRTFDFRFWRPV
jgi:hypothetical protein